MRPIRHWVKWNQNSVAKFTRNYYAFYFYHLFFNQKFQISKHFIYVYNISILLVEPWCEKESMLPVKVEILGISYPLPWDRIIRLFWLRSMDLDVTLAIAFQPPKTWIINIASLVVANIFLSLCLQWTISFLYLKGDQSSTSEICNYCAGNAIGRRPLKTTW